MAVTPFFAGSASAETGVNNASFESTSAGLPTCWQKGGVGVNTSTMSVVTSAHSGKLAAQLVAASYQSGNAKVVIDQRTPGCAPNVASGHTYSVASWFVATVPIRLVAYYRDQEGAWHWWAEGPPIAASTSWRQASYRTAPLPTAAVALSFGLSMAAKGTLILDDASLTDLGSSSSPNTSGPSGPFVSVSTAAELRTALSAAIPGTTIQLADGIYSGSFTLSHAGTSSAPVTIRGSRAAVLDGGSISSGYTVHLDKADYAMLIGFTVTGGQKSIVLDQTNHAVIDGLDTGHTGDESILLRNYSSDNTVRNSDVHDTGLAEPGYGEGIYIGQAYGNWTSNSSRTVGKPDASDRNRILHNRIHDTAAEDIDVKEGTSGGVIDGNVLDGSHMSGRNYADSWMDIAGNRYVVSHNRGTSALLDGIQTHRQGPGTSAANNVFAGNTLSVSAAGYGIRLDTGASGNVVYDDNTASGAASGLANVRTTPAV